MRGKKKKRIVETAGHERLLPACAECKSSSGNLWFLKFHASLFEQLCLYQEFGPMNFYISPISLFITESIFKGFIHTVERKGQYEEDVSKYCPAHSQFGSSLGSWNLKHETLRVVTGILDGGASRLIHIFNLSTYLLECVKKSHPNHNIDMRNEKHKTHQQNKESKMEITNHNNNKYSFSLSSNSGFLFSRHSRCG